MRVEFLISHRIMILLGLAVLGSGLWNDVAFAQGQANSAESLITQNNLFSPTRGPWTPPPPAEPEPPPPPKPEPPPRFVLYGVMIMGDEKKALLKEPQLTGGRVQGVPLGGEVGPYRLSRIESDRVVLEKEGSSVTVVVEDPARPKGKVLALPASPRPKVARPPQRRRVQPSASAAGKKRSPLEKLSEVFSKFSQRMRSKVPGQPGQQAPGQPAQ